MNEILIFSTTDTSELAQTIAASLVNANEAACVNIVPGIRSIYRWEGRLCDEAECLLIIKSTADRFDAINARIHQLHTYQVPEVIAVPIAAGDSAYLNWLQNAAH